MPTDTERREVARKLREFSKDRWSLTVGGNSATIRYAISDIVFGDKRYHSGVDLMNRLADLVEPSCDRDALLAMANEMVEMFRIGAFTGEGIDRSWCRELYDKYAKRVREACGEEP